MKGEDIVDAAIESGSHPLVIRLPNGNLIGTIDYEYSHNKRGEPILVIVAGREIKK